MSKRVENQKAKRQSARESIKSERSRLFRAAAILVQKDNQARGQRIVLLQRVERLLSDHPMYTGRVERLLKDANADLRATKQK
jgi:hypothetical protein